VDEEINWLHGEQVECSNCHQQLYRVDHSPFYDEHFLYCDSCPMRVEVSYMERWMAQFIRTKDIWRDD